MNNIKNLLLPLIREAGKIMTGARDIEGAVSEKGGDSANMVTVFDVAVQNFLMSEKKRHRDEKFHNNARQYKEIASRNCYAVNRQQAKGGK